MATLTSTEAILTPSPDYDGPPQDFSIAQELPAYTRRVCGSSRRRSTLEHSSFLEDDKGKKWIVLKINSFASSAASLPVLLGGDPITGRVDLDLAKPESIQSVVLWVKGTVTTSGLESRTFVELNNVLWDTLMGDPRNVTPGAKFEGKLSGQYTWPFSVILPEEVQDPKLLKTMRLNEHQKIPPTFSEKGSYSIIDYQVGLTVKRSGVFQRNNILYTSIGYTPRYKPDQPSSLRQMAYRDNTSLLDPSIDPQGWKVFQSVDMPGTLFSVLKVNVTCTLALATPLCYTRGSVIPCILTLESTDLQALDLLSNPRVPIVRLGRRINTKIASEIVKKPADATILSSTPLGYACWWPPLEDPSAASHTRTLQGEIKLPPHLVPSFEFGNFFVKYHLELLPSQLPGFKPAKDEPIFRANIDIATDYPDGPRPRAYLPPDYDFLRPELTEGDTGRVLLRSGFVG